MVICHLKPLIGRLERSCSRKQFLSKSTTESSPFLSYKKRQRRFDTFAQRLAWELNCFICFKFRSHLLPTLLPFINFVKKRTRPSPLGSNTSPACSLTVDPDKDMISSEFLKHRWEKAWLIKHWKECILFFPIFLDQDVTNCNLSSFLCLILLSLICNSR